MRKIKEDRMKSLKVVAALAIICLVLVAWATAAEAPAESSTPSVTATRIAEGQAAPTQTPAPQGQPIATTAEGEAVALTVYNDGNAIIKETRAISIPEGASEIRFEDVAATIDPTSVTFKSLTDPEGTTILEQNYEYDLVSADKILEKYLGKPVSVVTQSGTAYQGTLLSFDAGQVVVGGGKEEPLSIVARQQNVKSITADKLPEGLIIKPTLMWLLQAAKGGDQKVQVAYSASQCSWKADYSAILDADDKNMDFSGWVTLTNNSGKTYKDAALKLIAGEVHRAEQPRPMAGGAMRMELKAAAPQFEEKAFAEYHMYTLPRATTIKDNQIKQIELLTASAVPVEKKYLFDPMRGFSPWWQAPMQEDQFSVAEKGKVQTFIIFRNDEKSNMGMPLPAGRVRLFKYDGKDLEFVGEDSIDHTPKDEKVELNMGVAFDISADRTRTNFVRGNGANWMEESFKISIRNHKDVPITVYDREHLFRWTNWKITASSQEFTKLDAQTVEFAVNVAPNDETVVTYTARYEW
jgi:hypothetical protein